MLKTSKKEKRKKKLFFVSKVSAKVICCLRTRTTIKVPIIMNGLSAPGSNNNGNNKEKEKTKQSFVVHLRSIHMFCFVFFFSQ